MLQRKMVRFVYGWGPRSHVGTTTLRELGWLQIPDRAKYFAILHGYKIRKGLAPTYLSQSFVQVSNVHGHQTRASPYDFHISANDRPGSFSHFCKTQWNNFPIELKSLDSITALKVKLKRHLMKEY